MLFTLSAIGLSAIAVSVAVAQVRMEGGPMMVDPNFMNRFAPSVSCQVYVGVHIAMQNKGVLPIPAGKTLHWALAGGSSGDHVLAAPLPAGGAVLVENALPSPVPNTTACWGSVV
jgi:hypothetical protein